MIFRIPRLIEYISSIMALEVRVRPFLHGYYPFVLLFYTCISIIHFHFVVVRLGDFGFLLISPLSLSCFLFFSLCHSNNNQTQPGRRLDPHRDTIRRWPRCPRQSSWMPLSWRERRRTDQTGVFCSTKGRWLSVPGWGLTTCLIWFLWNLGNIYIIKLEWYHVGTLHKRRENGESQKSQISQFKPQWSRIVNKGCNELDQL